MSPGKRQGSYMPKHTWKDKHRLILALLDLLYRNHIKDHTLIFNQIHRSTLSGEGFKTGMPTTSITAQMYELKHGGTGSSLYEKIKGFSLTQICNLFDNHIKTIVYTAHKLKITLLERNSRESERSLPSPPLRGRRIRSSLTPSDTTITTWHPNLDEEDEDIYTPTKRIGRLSIIPDRSMTTLAGGFLYLRTQFNSTGDTSQLHPVLLFRAFEVNHGLTARRFLHKDRTIPPPPKSNSRAFTNQVQPHLARVNPYASPVLSFAEHPKVALKHIFAKIAAGSKMALAVFKYNDLEDDALRRFGPDSGPYLVPAICKANEIWDLPGGYTGAGEFLIWGSVTCKPVTIISGLDALMLQATLRTMKTITSEAGTRLNKYFPKIDDHQYSELFLYQLVTGYKVSGHHQARKSNAYLQFVHAATEDQSADIAPAVDEVGAIHEPQEDAEEESYEIVQLPEWLDEEEVDDDDNYMSDSSVEFVKVLPVRPMPDRFAWSDWRSDTEGL